MPAKSFIGEIEEAARRFYATAVRGEVSEASVRGYLRAASQIEDVWQQVDARVAQLREQGEPPWEAYARLRYALAYVRAARMYQVFVQSLLAADAAADPSTAGYLPQVTYDQANALCHQIQPNLLHAVAALGEEAFAPDDALPLALGPRLDAHGPGFPLPHLLGILAAARECREWAAGLIAEYANAVGQVAGTGAGEVPAEVRAHLAELESRLAQADAQLRFGDDLLGQLEQVGGHEAAPDLSAQAEDCLWDALETCFLLNQAVGMPEALRPAVRQLPPAGPRHHHPYRDRRIHPADLWRVAAPSARAELHHSEFGAAEMRELCAKLHGVLSARAQRYLDDVAAAVASGDASQVAAMATCPFEPLYRARRALELAGTHVPAGSEFHWNFHQGRIETMPRFPRANEWQAREA